MGPQLAIVEIAEKLNSSHETIYRYLYAIGRVSKLGKWVPYELSEENGQTEEMNPVLSTRNSYNPIKL